MKKILIVLLLFLIPVTALAEKQEVTLNKCVDGDTAWFNLNDEKIKTRFLAIDTPESTNKVEPYGKEASTFTCNKLKEAKKIEIEYDSKADKLDKYNRHLVWVFVDDELLQDLIVKEGLAEIKYVYDDYKYIDTLNKSLKEAQDKKLNLWSNYQDETIYLIIVIVIIVIACIFSKSFRNKTEKNVKKRISKEIRKVFK